MDWVSVVPYSSKNKTSLRIANVSPITQQIHGETGMWYGQGHREWSYYSQCAHVNVVAAWQEPQKMCVASDWLSVWDAQWQRIE